ncbi:MAG: HlyD family secretion protein [Alphaproteobacteria bacterium]|nr:HlyD family secretion protein [Alphaproteobacteria bacterium]
MDGSHPAVETAVPATPQRRPFGKRALGLAAGAFLLAGAAWYGVSWWTVGRFVETTDDAYVGGDITVIAPKVVGFIDQVAVVDNQHVHAGDLLIRLDDRDYRAQLARTKAMVEAQDAALANLAAKRRLQQAMIDHDEAAVDAASAELARTQDDIARYRELAAVKYASTQRLQLADADYKKAVAGRREAQAGLDAARRQIDVIDTQIRQAQADRDEALAAQTIAELNLGYTELRAPVEGVIGNRSARVGAYASIGTQLLVVVPAQGLWVDANFKENQLSHMRPGQPVTITADVLPGERFHGHVASLAPATGAQFSVIPPENATGNFTKIVQRVPVRIALDGEAAELGRLRPGLSVEVAVDQRPSRG